MDVTATFWRICRRCAVIETYRPRISDLDVNFQVTVTDLPRPSSLQEFRDFHSGRPSSERAALMENGARVERLEESKQKHPIVHGTDEPLHCPNFTTASPVSRTPNGLATADVGSHGEARNTAE
jgi:hypothetical protein